MTPDLIPIVITISDSLDGTQGAVITLAEEFCEPALASLTPLC